VDFADAVGVFEDPYALSRPDPFPADLHAGPRRANGAAMRRMSMRDEYDFSKARRGAILPVATGKTRITIRIDDDILDWFRQQVHRAGGGNYQTLVNRALRRVKEEAAEPLEVVVRRAVRAELRRKPRRPARARSGRAA